MSIKGINTSSMRWLREQHACTAGKVRVGRRSIARVFGSVNPNPYDLMWFSGRLKTADPLNQGAYLNARFRAREYGRWAGTRTRNNLLQVFERFDVQFPARLL